MLLVNHGIAIDFNSMNENRPASHWDGRHTYRFRGEENVASMMVVVFTFATTCVTPSDRNGAGTGNKLSSRAQHSSELVRVVSAIEFDRLHQRSSTPGS